MAELCAGGTHFAWGLKSKSHNQEPRRCVTDKGRSWGVQGQRGRELRALLVRNESTIEELFTQNS